MTHTIGITGHQTLSNPDKWDWVRQQFGVILESYTQSGDQAFSSLARGADQLFAEMAINHHLELIAVIPCRMYKSTFTGSIDVEHYESLLKTAKGREILPFNEPSEDAFLAAGKFIVNKCELLVAVWNGKAAAGKGGTGDIVQFALTSGRKVIHLNPELLEVCERG